MSVRAMLNDPRDDAIDARRHHLLGAPHRMHVRAAHREGSARLVVSRSLISQG
ncbi:MAG TPA: hypothetical protein VE197_22845 [Mycobacterium sp.]|nr:hypothetical protein [Mycobacterium sp.]